jgi:hypothetical protein
MRLTQYAYGVNLGTAIAGKVGYSFLTKFTDILSRLLFT